MPQRKDSVRECPGRCSARATRIREALDTEVPAEVRAHIGNMTVYKCAYCSTYWVEPFDADSLRTQQKTIGYHELTPSRGGDYWLMPDGQFRRVH